eukprot:2649388-Rhodomonas_salina.1
MPLDACSVPTRSHAPRAQPTRFRLLTCLVSQMSDDQSTLVAGDWEITASNVPTTVNWVYKAAPGCAGAFNVRIPCPRCTYQNGAAHMRMVRSLQSSDMACKRVSSVLLLLAALLLSPFSSMLDCTTFKFCERFSPHKTKRLQNLTRGAGQVLGAGPPLLRAREGSELVGG